MAEAIKEIIVEEAAEVKPYAFRRLNSTDVFPMCKIIGAIGVNEFKACFEGDGIMDMIKTFGNDGDESKNIVSLGISVGLEIANTIFNNLPKCESSIYQLLSQTSNLSIDEVKALDFVVFTEMIIDFVKKEEFKDFIKVVSKLFN